jgi:hypothetical protein
MPPGPILLINRKSNLIQSVKTSDVVTKCIYSVKTSDVVSKSIIQSVNTSLTLSQHLIQSVKTSDDARVIVKSFPILKLRVKSGSNRLFKCGLNTGLTHRKRVSTPGL